MSETLIWIVAALALAFAINLMPAFMPSTWMVMTFFYLRFGLPLLALTLGGAIVSGLGRLVLAHGSAVFRARFLGKEKQSDLRELGAFLDRHRHIAGPATFAYVLTPLPSNNLFIAAGMVGVQLRWVIVGFWLGRMVADTFWVWTTAHAFHSLGGVFRAALGGPTAIALQVFSLASVLLLYQLPWARWLRRVFDRSR